MSTQTLQPKQQRRQRTRAKVIGTTARPRLNVFISNRHIVAQVIDDSKGVTLAYVTTVKASAAKGNMTAKATWVGEQIAEAAKKHKVKAVVFDRGTKIYHTRLHALAEAARAKGLEF
jgi:large subunit ribosomal protein L18